MVAIWRNGRREHWAIGASREHAGPPTLDMVLAERKLTVEEYHRLRESGYLTEDDRIELIEGALIPMAALGGRHVRCVNRSTRALMFALGDRADLSIQGSLKLSDISEPEPDIAVLKPLAEEENQDRLPEARDVLFIIEVSDSSIGFDRGEKLIIYAKAGIREVWIVNLNRRLIEVYRDPDGDLYRTLIVIGRDDTIAPLAFPDVVITGADLLGRA